MHPFLSKAQQTLTSNPKKKVVEKEGDTSSESTKEEMDFLFKGIFEIDFEHPRLKKKIIQREFSIWSNSQPTRIRATKRKRCEFLSLISECEATME